MARWQSRAKETIEDRFYLDGIYHSSHMRTAFVYRRDDGSEFINQKWQKPVSRVNGRATVETRAKTVQPFDMAGFMQTMHESI